MGARNQVGIGLSYTPTRQSWTFRTIYGGCRNRIGIGLWYRTTTQPGGIVSLESILGLLKSLKIRAQFSNIWSARELRHKRGFERLTHVEREGNIGRGPRLFCCHLTSVRLQRHAFTWYTQIRKTQTEVGRCCDSGAGRRVNLAPKKDDSKWASSNTVDSFCGSKAKSTLVDF
jgi:hypothetical protein